ncbi:MAG: TetR family transcriptional regulator [Brevundimonas sp.]|uniref:TetR family transcriptional regulator n=1 Tax=Brevundimonas sp. TaxID=1871086 RepID=UPI0040340505
MQDVQELSPTAATGLRERKRIETHARIQAEAMRLFLAGGFDTTTLDDIAAAAGVSRRTLFHYFSSKEEIVFAAKADFPNMIVQAINRRPADEPLLTMVEMALTDMAAGHETPEAKAFARLIRDTPSLNAGDQAKYEKVERLVAATLAARKGLADDDLDCRITAAAAVGILKLSTEAWLADDGARPETFGRAAFAALRRVAADRRDD